MNKILITLLPFVLVGVFIILSIGSALAESKTYDEVVHTQEGINALTNHTFRIDTNNPPLIREISMAPTILGVDHILPPRFVTILLGALTCIAVYIVTKRYVGKTQACFALFLLALEPTFLGNSHYATLDIGATFFFFLAYVAFVRLMEKYTIKQIIITAILWGAAFASKITTIPFLLFSSFIIWNKQRKQIRSLLFFAIIIGIVIWATYFFAWDVIIAQRQDPTRVSVRLHKTIFAPVITFFEKQPLPLGNYLAVIKNTLMNPEREQAKFFFGKFYPSTHWYFMLATMLVKLPIPFLLLFLVGVRSKRSVEIFVIPVFVVVIIASFANIQPWIRYVLPAIPFMAIVASESISILKSPMQIIFFVLFCLWFAWGTGVAFPHYISYANEFVGSTAFRWTFFMDANLDWGQSLPDLQRYIQIVKPGFVSLSYFGRDNGDHFGLASDKEYGSYKFEDICSFHHINLPNKSSKVILAISVSNWYYCGYYKNPQFMNRVVKKVVGGSILVF